MEPNYSATGTASIICWCSLTKGSRIEQLRVHALKFQSIALPNGLIANMYGPVGKYTGTQVFVF